MDPIIVECVIDPEEVRVEDGGHSKYATVDVDEQPRLFARIHSWDDEGDPPEHPEFDALVGKLVRVTIEVIPEAGKDAVEEVENSPALKPLPLSGEQLYDYVDELEDKHGRDIARIFVRTKLRAGAYGYDEDLIFLREKLADLEQHP